MNENIFREYDVRGIVSTDFPSELIVNLGKAFGTYLRNKNQTKMSISGDVRHTTNNLKKDFISGVLSVGVDIYEMDVLPTPVNYFSLFNTDVFHSVQVTGSHNPSEYNGFKFSYNKRPFYGKSIQLLKKIIKENSYYKSDQSGHLNKIDILTKYSNFILENFNFKKKINVAMDCGNAVAGVVAPQLFKKLNINLNQIYCDINPDFPNHHPDPTVDENLKDLISFVIKNKCDLGIAYDGDADRIVAVDEKGNIIRSDVLISLFVEDVINEGDSVVYDVKCSKALEDTIDKVQGTPVLCKTGHSHIKNKMHETKSKVGGEMSGHIFFADKYFGYDDGIYVSLRLIELIVNKNKKLSELVAKIPKYESTPEIRIDCIDDDNKIKISKKAIKYFDDKYDCDRTDGVKIKFQNGWGLVRASNTQPVIVCRFEANNQNNLKFIKETVLNKLKGFGNLNV